MKKTKFLSVGLSLILSLSLIGCSSKNSSTDTDAKTNETAQQQIKDGGTMVFSARTDPSCLNPFFQQNRVTYTINNALFDPLYVVDKDEVRYYLAESMEASEDKLTYTLKLKDNLTWHDGTKITADDVVFSVDVAKDESQGIDARQTFVIDDKEVQANKIDDLTVEFKLPSTFAPFSISIGDFKIIPKHIFEGESNLAESDKNNNPVGSGPFKFKEWKKGEMITLERFDDYHLGKPHLDSVVYRIIPDDNTSKIAFENGEVSVSYLAEDKFETFSTDDRFKTHSFDEGMLNYLILNEKNENLSKKEVRQAISYALNKEEILKTSYTNLDNTEKAYSILTPNTKFYTDDVEKYDQNIEKAKELMKKSGVGNMKLNFQYTPNDSKIAMVVKQQLTAIGIEVDTQQIDNNVYFSKILGEQERDYDILFNGYVMGNDPNGYSGAYMTNGSFNPQYYSNKELDKLWKDGASQSDDSKRKEIYEKIQKTIADDAVIYPLDYSKSLIGVDSKFGGVEDAKLVPIYMFEDLSKIYMIQQ